MIKTTLLRLAFLASFVTLFLIHDVRADAGFTNNTIRGTLRFSNVNPAILGLLNAPNNDGMSNVYLTARSLPPQSRSADTDNLVAATRTSTPYQITVDSDATGIRYIVRPRISLLGNQGVYYFRAATSAPVVAFAAGPVLDFSECLGLVTLRFVTPAGLPVTVDRAQVTAFDPPGGAEYGRVQSPAGGVTQQRIYVPGGTPVRLDITVNRGTNTYVDRLQYFTRTNVTVSCDQVLMLDVVIPTAGVLSRIHGAVDMLGQFENTVDGRDDFDYPDTTTVVADYGPFSNKRYAPVPGINFSVPASGSYVLTNLVPSTLDPFSAGYTLYANMYFRTNRRIQSFRSPALGWGSNSPVVINPGAVINLSNTFVMNPGFLRGAVFLQGPAESLGRPSLLRGLRHPGDFDDDHDGFPDGLGTYGVYWTSVSAEGVNRRATGATLTAAYGHASTDFDGGFDAARGAYVGNYDMIVAGLKGERSLWLQHTFSTVLYSGAVTNDDDYFYCGLGITDNRAPELDVAPAQAVTNDLAYCFSEVCLRFRSANQAFYNPQVRFSSGGYTNTDFRGRPANYSVYVDPAYGVPNVQSRASTNGQVVMYLPQGTYQLRPMITPSNSAYAQVTGNPINLTVGCGQRICAEECLLVNVNAPVCSSNNTINITGNVRSCSNAVARITYSLNGGAAQTLCTGCGADPSFNFNVTVAAAQCVDHTLTITAFSPNGDSSFTTTTIRHDSVPPTVTCPADIVTACSETNRVTVNFTPTAADNCAGPVSVLCTPPSGSLFPAGTNIVRCVARDACGNQSAACAFRVVVRSSAVSIERAVLVRWGCGVLQGADNVNGPWTDIPGAPNPYCVPASQARQFYRTRN